MENQENANKPADGQTTQPEIKSEKLFTQAELDEIVKTRIAREKEKYQDFESLKKKATDYEVLRQEHEEAKSKLSALSEYESNFKSVYTDLESTLTEKQKALIPSEWSLVKKVEFIKNLKEATSPETPNATPNQQINLPKSDKKIVQPNTQLYGDGKYATIGEWVLKDPRGYQAWAKQNPNK